MADDDHASEPVAVYGVRERTQVADRPAEVIEEVERNGYSVIATGLAAAVLADMRAALDRVLAEQTALAGGAADHATLGEADTARALAEADAVFLAPLRDPVMTAVAEHFLGPAFILMQQNGIVLQPATAAHHQAAYHRDLPYNHVVTSRPLALSALLCLDAFTAENGGTWLLPGSHLHERFPSDRFVRRWETQIVAPAGAMVVFNAMTYHRSGANRSSAARRAVNTVFAVPLMAPQIVMTPPPGTEPALLARFSRDYLPAGSVADWQARRKARRDRPR
jgi:ectoine hydroxylase-related dioxygenase (phytanoyl-CoA dioxygenase family)